MHLLFSFMVLAERNSSILFGRSGVDILSIRDRLNEMPFKDGRRQVSIGRISDEFDDAEMELDDEGVDEVARAEDAEALAEYLQQLDTELQGHGLTLSRGEEDLDLLYAVQELRTPSEIDLSWMREALNWFSKITTVGLEMVVLGLIGVWLDNQFGTRFISPLGFAMGAGFGLWHLMQMTKGQPPDGVDLPHGRETNV